MADGKDKNGEDNKIGEAIDEIGGITEKAVSGVKEATDAIDGELGGLNEEFGAQEKPEDEETEAEFDGTCADDLSDEDLEEIIAAADEEDITLRIGSFKLNYANEYLRSGVSIIYAADPEVIRGYPYGCCAVFNYNVQSIDDYAFEGQQSLFAVYFLSDFVHIGKGAFEGCTNLERAVFEGGVQLDERAFAGCTNMTGMSCYGVVLDANRETFESTPWLEYNNYDFAVLGDILLKYDDNETDVEIPDDITVIGKRAFEGACVKRVKFPEYILEEIGEGAFRNSDLIEIEIPDGVEIIPEYAFCGCKDLERATIPESVTKIEDFAFQNCESLKEITILGEDTEISENAFDGCSSFIVKAKGGSPAEEYAWENGMGFKAVGTFS